MNLQEIRQKYPQYGDLTDQALADSLHKKYYADMPFEDFASRIGYQVAPEAGLMSGLSNLPGPVPLTDTPTLPNLTMPDLSGLPGPVPLTETPDFSAVPGMLKGLARPPEPQIDIPLVPAPAHVPNLLNVLTPSHTAPPPEMMVLPGGAGHFKGMPLGEPPISQEQAIGVVEMLGNLATAPVGLAGAGAAGVGAGIAGQGLPGIAKAAQEAAQGLTLQPSTQAGRELSGVMMAPFEALQDFDDKLAETVYEKTGSAFLGALIGTAPELLIAATPFLGRFRRGPGKALANVDQAAFAEGRSEGARLRNLAKTDPEAFRAAFEEALKRRMPPETSPEAQGPTIPKGPPPTPPEMPTPPRGPEPGPASTFQEAPYAEPLRTNEGPLSVGGRIERGRGPGEGGQDLQLHPAGGGAPPQLGPPPPQAGPAVQEIAPLADPSRILGAYQDLKKAGGYSNVAISDIRDKAGITQEQMDAFLRDPANVEKYGVSLSVGDWSLSPEPVRSGAVTFPGDMSDMGQPRKYLLAKFEPEEAQAPQPEPEAPKPKAPPAKPEPEPQGADQGEFVTPKAPPEQPAPKTGGSVPERLRATSARMKQAAETKFGQSRLENTPRRARQAEHSRQEAAAQIAKAETMARIADAMDVGEVKALSGVRDATHIDLLESFYRLFGDKPDKIHWPRLEVGEGVIGSLKRDLEKIHGGKALSQQITGRYFSEDVARKVLDFQAKHKTAHGSIAGAWQLESDLKEISQLRGMGIQDVEQLRAAVDEYSGLREAKRMGAEVRFKKIPGFFPTPAPEEAGAGEPRPPPAAELQVKIEPKGDTIEVKPKLTKAEEKALAPKEQKKYLLAEVDAAIKLAPAAVFEQLKQESLSKIQTVTIHVPGDGDFTILNSKPALKKFKKLAEKFPTTPGDGDRKPTVPSTKPTGKRLDDFIGWYYNPFQARKEGVIEQAPDGGKAGKPNQYLNGGFFSDGSYIVQVKAEPKLKHPVALAAKPAGEAWGAPDLADHIKQLLAKEKKYQPVEIAAELFDNATGTDSTAPVLAHVKLNGKDQVFQAKYIDSILTEHPGAKPFARMKHENDPLFFKDGGKLVGVVYPILLNTFRFTEEINKHFTPPPKEAPEDEAPEVETREVSASKGRYATELMAPERLSREVSVKYQTEDGATATVKQAADEALSEIDEQTERMKALQKCLES
jgi:hypothetical protein